MLMFSTVCVSSCQTCRETNLLFMETLNFVILQTSEAQTHLSRGPSGRRCSWFQVRISFWVLCCRLTLDTRRFPCRWCWRPSEPLTCFRPASPGLSAALDDGNMDAGRIRRAAGFCRRRQSRLTSGPVGSTVTVWLDRLDCDTEGSLPVQGELWPPDGLNKDKPS